MNFIVKLIICGGVLGAAYVLKVLVSLSEPPKRNSPPSSPSHRKPQSTHPQTDSTINQVEPPSLNPNASQECKVSEPAKKAEPESLSDVDKPTESMKEQQKPSVFDIPIVKEVDGEKSSCKPEETNATLFPKAQVQPVAPPEPALKSEEQPESVPTETDDSIFDIPKIKIPEVAPQKEVAAVEKPFGKTFFSFSDNGDVEAPAGVSAIPAPVDDVNALITRFHDIVSKPAEIRFAFQLTGANSSGVQFLSTQQIADAQIYFVGDIHGDYPAMRAICDYVQYNNPKAVICFCGDIIDRGNNSLECILYLLKLWFDHPEQIIWLRGNHEDALAFQTSKSIFTSNVTPAGFADFLNEHPEYRQFGQDLIQFIALLPSAVFFPDGLLFAHAGVPMEDLLPKITSKSSLSLPEMLQDFTWANIIPEQERKRVARTAKRVEYGRVNVDEFFAKCNAIGLKVRRLMVGHIHPAGGFVTAYEQHADHDGPRYQHSRYLREATILHGSVVTGVATDEYQAIAVAKYCADAKPDVKLLRFTENTLKRIYPQP